MKEKPTYEELEKKANDLEKQVRKLNQEIEELEIILEVVPVIIFQKDKDGKVIRTNKAFQDLLRISKEEVLGKTTSELFPEYGKDMIKDDLAVIKLGTPKRNIVERYDTPEGVRWSRTGKVPLKDNQGNVIGLIGYAADITDLRQAEEAVERERVEREMILDSQLEHVIYEDTDMRILCLSLC